MNILISLITLSLSVWLSPPSFSPTGKKFRSKPQLSRYLGNTVDLGCFDFRTGKMMPGKLQKNKQRLRHDPLSLAKVTLMDRTCGGGLWQCCGCVVCYQIIRLRQLFLQKVDSSAGQSTNTHSPQRKNVMWGWNLALWLLNFLSVFCSHHSCDSILYTYTLYQRCSTQAQSPVFLLSQTHLSLLDVFIWTCLGLIDTLTCTCLSFVGVLTWTCLCRFSALTLTCPSIIDSR